MIETYDKLKEFYEIFKDNYDGFPSGVVDLLQDTSDYWLSFGTTLTGT